MRVKLKFRLRAAAALLSTLTFAAGIATMLPAGESQRISLALSAPQVFDLADADTGVLDPDELRDTFVELIRKQLTAEPELSPEMISSQQLDSETLVRRARDLGYPLAATVYVMRDANLRLGIGVNIYETETGYVVSGRSAFGASDVALAHALERGLAGLGNELRTYLSTRELERRLNVRRITLLSPVPDVVVTFADGRSVAFDDSGAIVLDDPPYRVGQTITLSAHRPGYYPQTVDHYIDAPETTVSVPRLQRRTRYSLGGAAFPAHGIGLLAVGRWYPRTDTVFAELTGGTFRVSPRTELASQLEEDLDDLQAGEIEAFRLDELGMSVGAYLFATPARPIRPGLQLGAGVMHAQGSGWDATIPYLAPINPFVSFGTQRLRARVVTALRYTFGAEAANRRWLITEGPIPYGRLEVSYTW